MEDWVITRSSYLDPSSVEETNSVELALTIIVIISSAFSVIGACFILVGVLFPQPKSMSRQIVFMMAIADLMVSFPALLGCLYRVSKYPDRNPMANVPKILCKVQAYFVAVGALLSFIWTAGLSQHIFLLVKYGVAAAYKGFIGLFVISIFPFALNVYTYQADILGNLNNTNVTSQNWCFIKQGRCIWMIWDQKLIELICYVIITVYSILAYRVMNENSEDVNFGRTTRARKLILIPVIFILTRLSGTIITLYVVSRECDTGESKIIYFIRFPQSFFDNAQGWINWILFWWTINGGRQFVLLFKKCFGTIELEEQQIISEESEEYESVQANIARRE